ncbi:MAG: class I SAM-dependent methyltransferase [Proteobacteria bacterium]|nr:class I SAM-dependent methyltransferase [Pseudomonadota bacterium]
MTQEIYDRTYFEDGLASGKSLYNGFKWIPERSFQEAMAIIDAFSLTRDDKILEFGCAKGFLVKALRYLGRDAYGCDVSRYAICTADSDVRQYLKLCTPFNPFPYVPDEFDLIVAKDVLEHLEVSQLDMLLDKFRPSCEKLFVAVPIGDGTKFIVPEYNYDVTHKIAESTQWWIKKFQEHGYEILSYKPYMPGMKNNWTHYANGNCFFSLSSE